MLPLFEAFGEVAGVEMLQHDASGSAAVVEFKKLESCIICVHLLDGKTVAGQVVSCKSEMVAQNNPPLLVGSTARPPMIQYNAGVVANTMQPAPGGATGYALPGLPQHSVSNPGTVGSAAVTDMKAENNSWKMDEEADGLV